MKEPFLVNPPGKKRKKRKKASTKRKTASRAKYGRTVTGRRKRKPGPKKGSARKATVKRKRTTKAVVKRIRRAAPRKVRVSKRVKRTGRIRRVSVNPPRRRRRKSYRRNPVGLGGIFNLKALKANIPFMLTGGVSAVATTMAPGLLEKVMPTMAGNQLAKYGSQVGMVLAGAFVMDKTIKKGHGTIWMIVGGATMAADLIKTYVLPQIGLADYSMEGYELDDYSVSDYGDDDYYSEVDSLDAFPATSDPYSEGLDAFPDMEDDDEYDF